MQILEPPMTLRKIFQSTDALTVLDSLQTYIEKENFKGYDPYDTLTSPFPFQWFTKWAPIIATQIQKRNPLNIRPLLGITKDYNPKAMGLLLNGYCLLQKNFPQIKYTDQINFIYNWLHGNKSPGFSNACWGYNFGWASPEKYLPPFAPTVVATAFVAKGIFEYHQLTKDDSALELLSSISKFITDDLPVTETAEGICYSYSPFMKDCCYNASLLAAETLARIYSITKEEKLKSTVFRAVDFVVARQHSDGHWKYKIDINTGMERHQIDFHQGYVIDSIIAVMNFTNTFPDNCKQAVVKGASFYRSQQFFENGQSKWRLPKAYPVEIHNQSQGIITFSKMAQFEKSYFSFAKTILDWTITNMQDTKEGYFYYRKLRYYTNKISFMRWSNAWMFLAMAEYLDASKKLENQSD